MNNSFGEALHRLRKEKKMSQQQLADMLYVNRSSIANWESGRRLPDALMISRLSACLETDVALLIGSAVNTGEKPVIIVVDDNKIVLSGSMALLESVFPDAEIIGFTNPAEALVFSKENKIAIAFLDIEMGNISGIDLCRDIIGIRPHTNIFFLTAYPEYSLDAWDTGACGFLVKPLSAQTIRKNLNLLRYPISGLGVVK